MLLKPFLFTVPRIRFFFHLPLALGIYRLQGNFIIFLPFPMYLFRQTLLFRLQLLFKLRSTFVSPSSFLFFLPSVYPYLLSTTSPSSPFPFSFNTPYEATLFPRRNYAKKKKTMAISSHHTLSHFSLRLFFSFFFPLFFSSSSSSSPLALPVYILVWRWDVS